MVSTTQHEQGVEIRDEWQPEAEIVCNNGGERAGVWLRGLVSHCQRRRRPLTRSALVRMLRAALNVSWEDHIRNVDLYGFLPRLTLSGNGAWDSLDTAWDTQSSLPVNSSYGNPPTEEDPEVDLMQHTSTHWSVTLAWKAWLKYDLSWRKEWSGGLLYGVPESALVSCSPYKVLRYIYTKHLIKYMISVINFIYNILGTKLG